MIKALCKVMVICMLVPPALNMTAQNPVTSKKATDTKSVLKGQVFDSNKSPIYMATVRVKGSTKGAHTDQDGKFAIDVRGITIPFRIIVSYVGMKPKEMTINELKDNYTITLDENTGMLSEVVATGMREVKREEMTGSAKVITAREIRTQGVASIDKLLDGMVVGLNATSISGAPGTRAKITIRGENSLSGNTEPLWVIDGLPMLSGVPKVTGGNYTATIMQDGVGNVMPEDIESISILKDASAASIYGARAANGVIVITTKKGFRSKTQVNYSGTATVSHMPGVDLGMMNSGEKLSYEKMVIDHFGLGQSYRTGRGGRLLQDLRRGFITAEAYKEEINKLSMQSTDWIKEIFRPAFSHVHNLNVRGGTEELTYYTSLSYAQQQGILRSNGYENMGLLLNLDYRPGKDWIFSANIGVNTRTNRQHASAVDPFKYAVFANPYERPYDESGNYAADLSYLSGNYTTLRGNGMKYDSFNILRELEQNKTEDSGIDTDATLAIRWTPIKDLTLSTTMRRNISFVKSITEIPQGTYTGYISETLARRVFNKTPLLPKAYDNGELRESAGRSSAWAIRLQADYSWKINQDHLLTFFGAFEALSKTFSNFGYNSPLYYQDYRIVGLPQFDKKGLSYDDVQGLLAGLYDTRDGQERSLSYIGSLMYNLLQDKYIFSLNFRADGADVIGNVNRFTPLGSIGLRYNLHKEKWFALPGVREMSLRSSLGYTGNIDRSAYPFSVLRLGSNTYMGNRMAEELRYPNPVVKWEQKRDFGLAWDGNILDRVFFTAEYYNNRTSDILTDLVIPQSTGRTNIKANGGIVENRGWELDLRVKWIERENLLFSTNFNIARNQNIIVRSLHNPTSWSESTRRQYVQGGVINLVGHEIGSVFGWKYAGVNPDTGNPRYYLTEEARRAYAEMLDGWNNFSDAQKLEKQVYIENWGEMPGVVDFVNKDISSYIAEPFFLASMQYLGRSIPLYVGGFGSYLKWNNFEFTTQWTYKLGHIIPLFSDLRHAPNADDSFFGSQGVTSHLNVSGTNRERRYLGFWKRVGDITDVPRFTTFTGEQWSSNHTSDKYASGDYLRLSDITLSYKIPDKITKKMNLSTLRVSLNARNLMTFTKYRGLDVATQGAFNYPVSRDFTLKVVLGI